MFWISGRFWIAASATLIATVLLFLWELGWIDALPSPDRPAPTQVEIIMAAIIVLLLSIDVGLYAWQRTYGTCPVGTKRAAGIGASLGTLALVCPACTFGGLALLGIPLGLSLLTPFIPLFQIIGIILLTATLYLLWPKGFKQ